MTNREHMQLLSNEDLETVMHTLYFNPKLWIPDEKRKYSTPLPQDIHKWLNEPYNSNSEFWTYIMS